MKVSKPPENAFTILYQCLKCKMFHYTLASSLECCHKPPKRMFAVGRVREGKVEITEGNLNDGTQKLTS